MDIWEWVSNTCDDLRESGHARLAELIDELPTACCDGHHDRVESMAPEALALARAVKNPWLELFVRHWLLQSRVLHRHDVSRDTLQQAVSLVEFASHPETKDCPQAICAVQDLCSAYGLVDGRGYTEQRLAVTEEALSRIEPSRSCFDCVSAERASALIDAGRYQEALQFCDQQLRQRPEAPTGIGGCRFICLTALGRHEEAKQAAERIDLSASGASGERTQALYLCLAEARLGDRQSALARLPPANELEPEHFACWLRCVRALGVGDGMPNTWRVERALARMDRVLRRAQSNFTLAKVHKIAAELALQRGARASGLRHVEAGREAALQLTQPDWLQKKLDRIAGELTSLPQPIAASTVESLREQLGQDPEQDLERLAVAPELLDPALARQKAAALAALGDDVAAERELVAAVRKWPHELGALAQLLDALLARGEHERLAELCESVSGPARPLAEWALARSFHARADAGRARACCESLLSGDPAHHEARSLLANLLRDDGQLERALAELQVLVDAHEPGNFDWDRALVATLCGRWDIVREVARRLELPVDPEGSGAIEESWGPCRIRVRLTDGRERAYFAWRTGPVTARIDEVVDPSEEQHHADVVAFDAAPLNQEELDAHDPDSNERRPLCEYAAYRTLVHGGYRSFEIDGFTPAATALVELKAELSRAGIVWEQRSGDQYQLRDGGRRLPATYAFLGLPPGCDERTAHAALLQASERLGLRFIWPKLAAAAGDAAIASEQRRLGSAWGIE